jgi:hypothetical protein
LSQRGECQGWEKGCQDFVQGFLEGQNRKAILKKDSLNGLCQKQDYFDQEEKNEERSFA